MKQGLRQRGGKGRNLFHAAILLTLTGIAGFSFFRGPLLSRSTASGTLGFAVTPIAGVRQVPGEYATIQAAVDAAQYGETVLIAPGTYLERVSVTGKKVTLRGAAGTRAHIVGDGKSGPIVQSSGIGATGSAFEHLNISGGRGNDGCGLLIDHADVVVRDCVFAENAGGGVVNLGSSSSFFGCAFEKNGALVAGGGIRNEGGSPTIADCMVRGNTAGTFGGGVYSRAGKMTIVNSTVAHNSTQSGAWGGGIYSDAGELVAMNTEISQNASLDSGGGVFVAGGSAELSGCKFLGNYSAAGWNVGSSGAQISLTESTICGEAETSTLGDGINTTGATFTSGCFDDANHNGRDDAQEIALGIAQDCDGNGVPDDRDPDCNQNGIVDRCEIRVGWVHDCNNNGVPDRCEIDWGLEADEDADGMIDGCTGG